MLMGTAPRPVHFLIKKEAFVGPLGGFLEGIGQVEVDRESTDRKAIGNALGVLEQGGVLGIFPEGTRGDGDFASLRAGLAYFALRSGAPIVPVAVLGSTERRGRLVKALPPLRARVDVVFGDAFDAGTAPAGAPARRSTRRPFASREAHRPPGKRQAPHRALSETLSSGPRGPGTHRPRMIKERTS